MSIWYRGRFESQGDACTSCGADFMYSFATFDRMPLVRFELAQGISDQEAAKLLAQPPPCLQVVLGRSHHLLR